MKEKVIEKGEKVTSGTLNKIFQIKNPDSQIIFIMKIIYQILNNNIDIIIENSSKNINNININNDGGGGNKNNTNKNLYKKENIT